jgi:predicted P-loop ATPase
LFVGTVNEHEYLRDATGGRRFWPLGVGVIDLVSLREDRDQLLAEAVYLCRAGARWWPSPEFEAKHIRDEQEARYVEDPWRSTIAAHLAGLTTKRVTVGGVAKDALMFKTARVGMREAHRIRDVLTQLEWTQKRTGSARWYEPQEEKPT